MSDQQRVYVWDIVVRLGHWSLVATFFIAYFTEDDFEQIHVFAGYIVLGIVVFRLLWGVVGTRYARFSSFVTGYRKLITYLDSLVKAKPKHYLGHNPAGAVMVLLLLASLFMTCWSGLKLYAYEEGKGPLAYISLDLVSTATADDNRGRGEYNDHFWKEFWEELHEYFANFTLILIGLHVLGVMVSSRLHRESLVKAMITGYKSPPE